MTDAPTADRILAAWETGLPRGPLDRSIVMLWALDGDGGGADMPLAQRDRALLNLRRRLFGETLQLRATCPGCGAPVELELSADSLADSLIAPERETVRAGGRAITVRALTSRDLAAVAGSAPGDLAAALRRRLADPAEGLNDQAAETLDRIIEDREAATEIALRLRCADCGADWRDTLDIGTHVWIELAAHAERLLGEIAEIAARFGWAERDILALSPSRRAAYLDIVRRSA